MALEEDGALAHIPGGERESVHECPRSGAVWNCLRQECCQPELTWFLAELQASQRRGLEAAWPAFRAICAAPGPWHRLLTVSE